MDRYSLLGLFHIVGFISLGGGLLAMFISKLRTHCATDVHAVAEAAWYTAAFYAALVVPGAILVGLSGLLLIVELRLGFFSEPWLVGMWGLFLFEFIERVQFRRILRHSRKALESGELTNRDRAGARTMIGQVAHFLDVPLFLVIVYFGAIRPATWIHVIAAIAVALVAGAILMASVSRVARSR